MFTIDAHLDLSMNAMEWNRDLRLPAKKLNAREQARGLTDKPDRGNAVVSFPDLRRGEIGLVVATQIARFVAPDNPLPGWNSPEQAWSQTQAQLHWYRTMEEAGELVQVVDTAGLDVCVLDLVAGDHRQCRQEGDDERKRRNEGYHIELWFLPGRQSCLRWCHAWRGLGMCCVEVCSA